MVVAGRQVGRFRIEPPVAIRSRTDLYAIYLYRVRRVEPGDADHEHDLQLQSRQVVSDRLPGRSVRPVPANRRVVAQVLTNPPEGPYGLSSLDLTPLNLTF